MKILIFSDLHDNHAALAQIFAEARRLGAHALYYLGDVGRDPALFRRLQEAGIPCVFGNWEVSGYTYLPADLRTWVAQWPALRTVGDFAFAHATPEIPAGAESAAGARTYMRTGRGWSSLFPRLDRNEEAVWRALAAMEESGARVAFHGHTHVQKVWAWRDGGTGRRLLSTLGPQDFAYGSGSKTGPNRYIVGVGSAGQPQDGPRGGYALVDDESGVVEIRLLSA